MMSRGDEHPDGTTRPAPEALTTTLLEAYIITMLHSHAMHTTSALSLSPPLRGVSSSQVVAGSRAPRMHMVATCSNSAPTRSGQRPPVT